MNVHKEQLFAPQESIDWTPAGAGIHRKIMSYGDTAMAIYVEFEKGALIDFFNPMREDFLSAK